MRSVWWAGGFFFGGTYPSGCILLSPENSVHPTKGWAMLSIHYPSGETEEGGC